MSITLNRRTLSALAKLETAGLKHTERLTLFAKALGFADQTAMMAMLKAGEAAGTASAPEAPQNRGSLPSHEDLMKVPLDELVTDILTARLSRLRDEPNDPWPRNEWREDVLRGDTIQDFEGWHAAQVESYCEQIRIDELIDSSLKMDMLPQERNELIRRFAETMELLEVFGGADALGEEIFENLEWLQECVETGDKAAAWQADEVHIGIKVQIVGAWKKRNAAPITDPEREALTFF